MEKRPTFRAIVNQQLELDISAEEQLDLVETGPGLFHIISGNKSFKAEVIRTSLAERSATIKVNENLYDVKLEDQFDLLVKQLGFSTLAEQRIDQIKAPMPGLVLEIMVQQGQEIKAGDHLIILEAMKMENVIKAPADGSIKEIPVQVGQAVEKNQVLIQLH